jgi:ribosome-binding factor A
MKRTTSRRSDRLADQIAREMALALVEDVRDPRLELVTISGAALNADLSVARVYYTLSGDEARMAAAAKALEQARGYLRTLLGQRLRLKFVPELRFARDTFLEDMVYAHPEA